MEKKTISAFEQQSKGKLLYESKGGKDVWGGAMMICGILFCIVGVFIVIQILHGSFRNPVNVVMIGVVFFIIGALCMDFGVGTLQCWVKIYSDCIEAQAFAMGGKKKIVQIYYSQINSVQIQGNFLNIISGGQTIRLICKENEQAFQIINTMIANV